MKDIQRLLAAFPATSQADPALVLHNYLMSVEDWPADIVTDAVDQFMKGNVPGWDGRFAPTPPMLGSACRRAQEAVSRANYLTRISRPALPPPDITHTDEERARAKAKVAEFVASVSDDPADEATIAIRNARWAKVNARFDPPQDDESLAERLHLRRGVDYSVGAPESDDAAA